MDFGKCRWDPTKKADTLIWKVYPELQKYPPLSVTPNVKNFDKDDKLALSDKDWSKAIRYAMAFSLKLGNPLAYERDFNTRRARAMEAAGIDRDNPIYEAINQDHFIMRLVLYEVIKFNHDDDFALWVALRQKFYSDLRFLSEPAWANDDGARTDKVQNNIEKLKNQIKALEIRIFADDETRNSIEEISEMSYFYAELYAKNYGS